jgi:hypothetical protein
MLIHSGVFKGGMAGHATDVQSLHYPAQLPVIDLMDVRCGCRPTEMLLLQSLLPEAKAVAVPVEHLDHIAPSIAEHKQMPGQRVHFQVLGHQNGQTVDRFAHIRAPRRQIDPGMKREKHQSCSRTPMSWVNAAGSNPRSTAIRNRPPTIRHNDPVGCPPGRGLRKGSSIKVGGGSGV